MDERIQKLMSRVRELRLQLQECKDQTKKIVLEAACEHSNNQAELEALHLDREVDQRLKQDKLTLEENTGKRCLEMENVLFEANAKLESARKALRGLEVENVALRQEMVVAESHVAGIVASLEEVTKREKENRLKSQSLEKHKLIVAEELDAEKCKFFIEKQEAEQAEERKNQSQAWINNIVKEKGEILLDVSRFKGEKEDIEVVGKVKLDEMISKAEKDKNNEEAQIKCLNMRIAALRPQIYSAKAAEYQRGAVDVFLPRDGECVMCFSEEPYVVFLPCGHRVLCLDCNDIHEQREAKHCPFCNSQIQQRIQVRNALP